MSSRELIDGLEREACVLELNINDVKATLLLETASRRLCHLAVALGAARRVSPDHAMVKLVHAVNCGPREVDGHYGVHRLQ